MPEISDIQIGNLKLRLVFLSVYLIGALPLYGQGSFLVESYSYQDYSGHRQNWSITQDESGRIFFGNNNSLIWFDGARWHDQHISNNSIIRSLYTTNSGHIYYGTVGDFGFLYHNNQGELVDSSLAYLLPDSLQFNEIFNIQELDYKIYFQSRDYIFVLEKNTIQVIDHESDFSQLNVVNDQVFVRLVGKGLFEFNELELVPIQGGEYFDSINFLSAEKIASKILFTSAYSGISLYDGKSIEQLDNNLSQVLANNTAYRTKLLDSLSVVFATLNGGIVIADIEDWSSEVINESDDLTDNQVHDLLLDHEENIWAVTDNGISKIALNQEIRIINALQGLSGNITDLAVVDDQLYVLTTSALFYWDYSSEKLTELPIKEPISILEYGKELIVSSSEGLKIISPSRIGVLSNKVFLTKQIIIEEAGEKEIVGVNGSGVTFYRINGRGVEVKYEVSHKEGFISVIEWNNNIYTLSRNGSLFEISKKGELLNSYQIDIKENYMARSLGIVDDELNVGTDQGMYRFENDNFIPNDFLNSLLSKTEDGFQQFFRFNECEDNLWIFYNRSILRVNQDIVYEAPYQVIGDNEEINTIKCLGSEVWFGGNAGVYALKTPDWNYKTNFKTNVTGTFIDQDSLIYGGFGEPSEEIILPYKDNALRFTYAAASYIDPERNTYSYKLEGFDATWSDFSLETQKDYTNIPEGDYVFKVKSKNVFGVEGSTDSFAFTILPPWYRTWWAYLLYVIGISGLIYTAHRIRLNQLLKVERMRTKIASDLHDEVSATLTGISYFAEAVKTDKDEHRKSHFINLITESAGDAKEKITDIVWSITPENDNWELFLSKCRRYASDLLESSDIKYNLNITQTIEGALPMNVRQHLWMIFKEMLTNTVRHSQASQVDVILDVEEGFLKLVVQDNGKGFDVATELMGNGVSNIKKRANEIRAKIDLNSEPGMGARWRLELKL